MQTGEAGTPGGLGLDYTKQYRTPTRLPTHMTAGRAPIKEWFG